MIDDGGIDFRFEQLTWSRQDRIRTIISWIGAVILFENLGHPCKSNRDSVRKARKAYLIERGQTLEPHGLNKKDETSYVTFVLAFYV